MYYTQVTATVIKKLNILIILKSSLVPPLSPVAFNVKIIGSAGPMITHLGIKINILGRPWWSSGKESACQRRGHRFHPWPRKIPHATGQLKPVTTTTEACTPRAWALQQEKPLE